jgi:hypothetical protein
MVPVAFGRRKSYSLLSMVAETPTLLTDAHGEKAGFCGGGDVAVTLGLGTLIWHRPGWQATRASTGGFIWDVK